MLNHLRQRAVDLLAAAAEANLSTYGPAGIQARIFPCEAIDTEIYLLVPGTSDQLFNLENNAEAAVTTAVWQLRGVGRVLALAAAPPALRLLQRADAAGCVIVAIQPGQLQINHQDGWGYAETIDFTTLNDGANSYAAQENTG